MRLGFHEWFVILKLEVFELLFHLLEHFHIKADLNLHGLPILGHYFFIHAFIALLHLDYLFAWQVVEHLAHEGELVAPGAGIVHSVVLVASTTESLC